MISKELLETLEQLKKQNNLVVEVIKEDDDLIIIDNFQIRMTDDIHGKAKFLFLGEELEINVRFNGKSFDCLDGKIESEIDTDEIHNFDTMEYIPEKEALEFMGFKTSMKYILETNN